MTIKRVVPNIESETPQSSIEFYEGFIGLKVAMEMDWIITFISESNPNTPTHKNPRFTHQNIHT